MDNKKEKFKEIFIKYLDSLYNWAIKLTNNLDDAQDLVQDTFLRTYRFFPEDLTNIKSFLFKVMYNIFINKYRKQKKEPEVLELNEEISIEQNPADDFFSKFLDKEIQEALDSIPSEFKEAVILSDIEQMSYKEIAQITGCPVGTVRSRLSRGRNLLYKKLYDYAKSCGYIR